MKPVSKTAFYCCGLRMEDAKRERPVCGDTYAELFMNEEAVAYLRKFDEQTSPNSSNLLRHRLIDDIVAEALVSDPRQRVFTIGAGFDTRPYRLGGGRWTELDAPELMAYKEERLPAADAPNELTRLSVDFDSETLRDKLAELATDEPVLFVIEGVLLYVETDDVIRMLETLTELFPSHRVVCDIMTLAMFEKYALGAHEIVAEEGAVMKVSEPDLADVFTGLGYDHERRVSIVEEMRRLKMPGSVPNIILRTFFRTVLKGYTVNVFSRA